MLTVVQAMPHVIADLTIDLGPLLHGVGACDCSCIFLRSFDGFHTVKWALPCDTASAGTALFVAGHASDCTAIS